MRWCRLLLLSLLELFFPEFCAACGAVKGTVPWVEQGSRVPGLQVCDAPHLCAACYRDLCSAPPLVKDLVHYGGRPLPVWAAQGSNPLLVKLVSAWKYESLRGLAWPLAKVLAAALVELGFPVGANLVWLPVPLHGRRERERGFNQSRLLAGLLAENLGGRVSSNLAVRHRPTRQQAKLKSRSARRANVRTVFKAGPGLGHSPLPAAPEIILVDDLVTSGATVEALARVLEQNGGTVKGVVCLGVAAAG